jgi:hypothetical protein
MAQIMFATDTTPGLADLDHNFSELYQVWNNFRPSGGKLSATLPLSMSTANPRLTLDAPAAGQGAVYAVEVGAVTRWAWGMYPDSETGSNAGSNWFLQRHSDAGAYLGTALLVSRATGDAEFGGGVRPITDGAQILGAAGRRWSVVYASTGTINTSDAREKTSVRALSTAEVEAAKELSAEIGAFKFVSAIAAKGEANARSHIGMTVQRAIEIMEAHGLDPFAYGFICYDEWPATAATEAEPARPAGNRYSFRPDELLLFLARGFEARLAALEAAAA